MTQDELKQKPEDKEACGKLWEIYAKEAMEYDRPLVESWKNDMDAILVFSGLYSAILTAFIIESYQKLQEDPEDTSAALLKQISAQLARQFEASDSMPEPSKAFYPTTAALACNILWFSGLGLAITSAFLATFVQQWTRQFINRTNSVRSPTAQAPLICYLYFGLKRLGMHAVVDAIPSLLHLSIFLFFGGLIAFLVDVSPILVWITVAFLSFIIILYAVFSVMPVITRASFYRTPLSPFAWRLRLFCAKNLSAISSTILTWLKKLPKQIIYGTLALVLLVPFCILMIIVLIVTIVAPSGSRAPITSLDIWVVWVRYLDRAYGLLRTGTMQIANVMTRRLRHTFLRKHNLDEEANRSAMSRADLRTAMLHGSARSRADLRTAMLTDSRNWTLADQSAAIQWTMKSVNDDVELLPVIEAFVDALDAPNGPRFANYPLIQPLLATGDPHFNILSRVIKLERNSENAWFKNEHRERCKRAASRLALIIACILFKRVQGSPIDTSKLEWRSLEILINPSNRYVLGKGVTDALSRYLENPTYYTAYNLTEFVEKLGPFGLRMSIHDWEHDHNPLIRLQEQIEMHASIHAQDPEVVLPLTELDCVFLLICWIADPDHADFITSYIERRVEISGLGAAATIVCLGLKTDVIVGHQYLWDRFFQDADSIEHYTRAQVEKNGWGATRDIWVRFGGAASPLYERMTLPDAQDWIEKSAIALTEVVLGLYGDEFAQQWEFWELCLKNAESPSAHKRSLEICLMGNMWWKPEIAEPLRLHVLSSSSKDLDQEVHSLVQEMDNDTLGLSFPSLLLYLIGQRISAVDSPNIHRDTLAFYVKSVPLSNFQLVFRSPGLIPKLCQYTASLHSLWHDYQSIELYQSLVMVWLCWDHVSDGIHPNIWDDIEAGGKPILDMTNKVLDDELKNDMREFYRSNADAIRDQIPFNYDILFKHDSFDLEIVMGRVQEVVKEELKREGVV